MKDNMHSSMIDCLEKCGIQFEYRYVNGIIMPGGLGAMIGKVIHDLQYKEGVYKTEHGYLFTRKDALDITRDAFSKRWDEGVLFSREEKEMGLETVKGNAIDLTVDLGDLYHDEIAPTINPRSKDHVEWPWVLELDGFPFNLAGTTDIVEQVKFKDLKNVKSTPNQKSINSSMQYTIYGLAFETFFGLPAKFDQLTIVKNKKPKTVILPGKRSQADYDILFNHLEQVALILEKGVFTPASGNAWWCSSFCEYHDICKYFRGYKQYSIS